MLLHFIWRFWWVNINLLKGQADGSGEEDMSPIGSYSTANERGGLQRGVQSDGSPVQQDMDYPSSTTTTTLWSNSSRYLCLSFQCLSSVPYTFLKGEWWTNEIECFLLLLLLLLFSFCMVLDQLRKPKPTHVHTIFEE